MFRIIGYDDDNQHAQDIRNSLSESYSDDEEESEISRLMGMGYTREQAIEVITQRYKNNNNGANNRSNPNMNNRSNSNLNNRSNPNMVASSSHSISNGSFINESPNKNGSLNGSYKSNQSVVSLI